MKRRMVLAVVCCATLANAQSSAPAAKAPSSPAKKDLINKALSMQQAGIDELAKTVAERPVISLGQQAGAALQTVPAEKRDAIAKSIDADFKAYLEEAAPLIRDRVAKLTPLTVGAMLDEKMTEDELKQLVAWLESPVRKKYEQLGPELRNSLLQKLLPDVSPMLDPKLTALQEKVAGTLRAGGAKIPKPQGPTPAASSAKPVAKPASK
ncbi:MAG: DUF2059 domain-containing protein [Burkholderiales bacterium]|jgi:uncharacterized protein|nr:DUF2059 domain-containing protein [Burkholderiales bacterium]